MPIVSDYTALLTRFSLNQPFQGVAVAKPAFVTYSFSATAGPEFSEVRLDPTERQMFRDAITQWAVSSGLVAFETTMAGDIDVRVLDIQASGMATFPQSMVSLDAGTLVLDGGTETLGLLALSPNASSDPWVMIHEIGHALGLKHPHDGTVQLDPALDTREQTVMSYNGPRNSTLGPLDIQAIQALYGTPGADGDHVTDWAWDAARERLTQYGSAADELLTGTGAHDLIDTLGGADTVVTKGGDDIVIVRSPGVQANLGTGRDVVRIDFDRDQIFLIEREEGTTILHHADSESVFHQAERLHFDDEILAVDIFGNAGQAYKLYQAAFDRTPDRPGVSFWTAVLDERMTLGEVAAQFVTAPEFLALYGSETSDEQYVALLYNNVFDREPDQAGYDFWTDRMDEGLDRARMLVEFSESNENERNVIGQIVDGIWLDYVDIA